MTKRTLNPACCRASGKSGWLFLLWLTLLGGCQNKQQRPPGASSYRIVADLEGCTDCEAKLWSEYVPATRVVQSTNGRFSFKGTIAQPGLYGLYYYSKADKTVSGFVQLWLPADSIHISATKKKRRTKFYPRPNMGSYLKNTRVVSSSPLQTQWEEYLLARDSLWHKFFIDKAVVVAKFYGTFGSGNKALIAQWADSARSFDYRTSGYWAAAADGFVRQHPASVVSVYAMLDNRNDRPSVTRFRQYYNALPAPLRASFHGQVLDKELAKSEGRNRNNQRFVGHYIRRLAGKTPTGQALDVAQLFKHNKLTLVEFWASWCGPCRMEMPKYYQLYKRYHRIGFGLLGVSLDNDYNKWVRAIAADSLQIPHLSELQGSNGEDIRRFAVTGIPANFLVDSTGRIVAVDIPFPQLAKKVEQALR